MNDKRMTEKTAFEMSEEEFQQMLKKQERSYKENYKDESFY